MAYLGEIKYMYILNKPVDTMSSECNFAFLSQLSEYSLLIATAPLFEEMFAPCRFKQGKEVKSCINIL